MDGIEVDHHPTAPLDLVQVLRREDETLALGNGPLFARTSRRHQEKDRHNNRGRARLRFSLRTFCS